MLATLQVKHESQTSPLMENTSLNLMQVGLSLSFPRDSQQSSDNNKLMQFVSKLVGELLKRQAIVVSGGHLNKGSFVNVFHKTALNIIESYPSKCKPLTNYLGAPLKINPLQQSKLEKTTLIEQVEAPKDVVDLLKSHQDINNDLATNPFGSAIHRYAWARGMTHMRQEQVKYLKARVLIAGRYMPVTGDSSTWYASAIPGILEEMILSIEAKQPVFIVGGFGGMSGVISDILQRKDNDSAFWHSQQLVPFTAEMRKLYNEQGIKWRTFEELRKYLHGLKLRDINPLLKKTEFNTLLNSKNEGELTKVILAGLNRLSSSS